MTSDLIPLSVAEAIEACIEFSEEHSHFDKTKKAFVYTPKGWGSPRALYNALHDRTSADRIENHGFKGKPYAFKLQQFKHAIASGALKVSGRIVPIKQARHVVLDPAEAAYLEFSSADEVASYKGDIKYVELRVFPAEHSLALERRGAGQPSSESKVLMLHAENEHRITPAMTQTVYAETLQKAGRVKRMDGAGLALKTIQRHLTKHGILSKVRAN